MSNKEKIPPFEQRELSPQEKGREALEVAKAVIQKYIDDIGRIQKQNQESLERRQTEIRKYAPKSGKTPEEIEELVRNATPTMPGSIHYHQDKIKEDMEVIQAQIDRALEGLK